MRSAGGQELHPPALVPEVGVRPFGCAIMKDDEIADRLKLKNQFVVIGGDVGGVEISIGKVFEQIIDTADD